MANTLLNAHAINDVFYNDAGTSLKPNYQIRSGIGCLNYILFYLRLRKFLVPFYFILINFIGTPLF